jgi:hypothetical protein
MRDDDTRYRFKQRPKQPSTLRREPLKKSDESKGIFGIWNEQRRLQEEDERIAQELAEAKKKAKELKRTLYKNRFGESKKASKEKVDTAKLKAQKVWQSSLNFIIKRKKLAGFAVLLVVAVVGFQIITGDKESTGTLGESVSAELKVEDDLPREKPGFKLLFPDGNKASDYDVVRISPPEADASFTYLDRFTDDGQIFRVTQQEIPDSFDLAKTATDFQATSIIQVDDNIIYHGYSEKGGVQSILFVKDNKLISIRSPQKFSDDSWAGYYLSLK